MSVLFGTINLCLKLQQKGQGATNRWRRPDVHRGQNLEFGTFGFSTQTKRSSPTRPVSIFVRCSIWNFRSIFFFFGGGACSSQTAMNNGIPLGQGRRSLVSTRLMPPRYISYMSLLDYPPRMCWSKASKAIQSSRQIMDLVRRRVGEERRMQRHYRRISEWPFASSC